MEVFRDLEIDIDAERMAALADRMERQMPGGWTRDRAAEGRAQAAPVLTNRPTYCFTWERGDGRPAATVVLMQKDANTFFVSNIIPLTKHQFRHEEYNAILEAFYEAGIRPFQDAVPLTARMTNSQANLEDWMPRDTANLLRQFSSCATAAQVRPSRRPRPMERLRPRRSSGRQPVGRSGLAPLADRGGWLGAGSC